MAALPGFAQAQTVLTGGATQTVAPATTLLGDVLINGIGSALTVDATGQVTGDVDLLTGTVTHNGTIAGGIDTTGAAGQSTTTVIVGATGIVGGAVTLETGNLTSAGALNDGLTLGTNSSATIQAGGSINGSDTVVNLGTLTIEAGAAVNTNVTLNGTQAASVDGGRINNSGTITGNIEQTGGIITTDGTIIGDTTVNSGAFNAEGAITGDLTMINGTFTTTGLLTHTGNVDVQGGRMNVTGGDMTVTGSFGNDGILTIGAGRTLTAPIVTNTGLIVGNDNGTIDGDLASTGGEIQLNDGVVGDTFTITGDLTGSTTLVMDIDLSTANAADTDLLVVGGLVDGTVTIELDPQAGGFTLQSAPVILVDGTSLGGSLTATMRGIPQTRGPIVYTLDTDPANGDIVLLSGVNPAIGGVVGAFSSVQNLVGTVINRPSGAFVSGIAFDTPDNCSRGGWARAVGGRATSDTTTNGNLLSATGTTRTDFAGIQGGFDFGCFEAFDGGWDIVGGVLFGHNRGSVLHNSFGLTTDADFSQSYGGVYVNAAKGNFSAELQLRHERSSFDFMNVALGLDDSVSTNTTQLSGSTSYRFALENGMFIVPTAGFGIGRTSSGSLTFNGANGLPAGVLQPADHNSSIGFAGATMGRTMVDEASNSALTSFVTATIYNDFSSDRVATFTATNGGVTDTLTTESMGAFGELSVGLSYARVLSAAPSGIRQMNANIRADYRFNKDLKGASVTAQFRLQF
nr:autotransporter domain-containing protein [Roseibaca domitiana]